MNAIADHGQQPLIVLATCPDEPVAALLARALVEERLAACIQRMPLTASTYRWQGQVVEEAEVLLVIKTAADRYQALAARLRQLHPYQVPEIIALPVADGLPDYLQWLVAETRA